MRPRFQALGQDCAVSFPCCCVIEVIYYYAGVCHMHLCDVINYISVYVYKRQALNVKCKAFTRIIYKLIQGFFYLKPHSV